MVKKTHLFNNLLKRLSVFFSSCLGIDYERCSMYEFLILAIDNANLSTSVPVTIRILNRNDFCPELFHNSTALFFNTDLWFNNSNEKFNHYDLKLSDGDNDTCVIELLNFNDIFKIKIIERNHYLLYAYALPESEYYVLQFRLHDLVDETLDQSCIQHIQLVLTIGTNQTNQTVAIDTAREYLEALHLISQRTYSYFHLTLMNIILVFILLSILMIITLIFIKLIYISSKSRQQRKMRRQKNNMHTLYRLQGPTETQLPLLDNGPGEQSITSSLNVAEMNKSSREENMNHAIDYDDEQQQVKQKRI